MKISIRERNCFHLFIFLSMITYSSTLEEMPQIQPFSFPKDISLGQKASATCTARSGHPPFGFSWKKDGQDIQIYSPKVTVETIRDFSVIVIDPVDISVAGNYTCILSTSTGTSSYSTYLEVKVPPQWIQEPSDIDVLLGNNVTIICEVSGYPVPTVTWKRTDNGQYVQTQKQHPGKSILFLDKITDVDEGYYVCEVSNNVGKDINKEIKIKVIVLRMITMWRLANICMLASFRMDCAYKEANES
ncbi:cell adhesion molecule DSCAM-like [Centruroides vittatus]|uniref:cell adhesion molecule DSCAM-like n=1 Tax=Centruroides vittatus TaxID=120091 RepID=UPI00350F4994